MTDRWATFDCYGTLIDWMGGIRTALGRTFPTADADALLQRFHAIEPLVQAGRAIPYRQVLTESLVRLAEDEETPLTDPAALADSLPSWPPFPEVAEELRAVRAAGWRVAILSNTDPDYLDGSLARIGVPVDLRVTAADAGAYKPARGHWDRFFATTGAARDRHCHVAASLFHDVAPAAAFGFPCIWINRQAEVSDLPRAAELPDLRGLAAALDRVVPG